MAMLVTASHLTSLILMWKIYRRGVEFQVKGELNGSRNTSPVW